MSGLKNKSLHCLPFFDSVIDYDTLKTQYLHQVSSSSQSSHMASDTIDEAVREGIINSPKDYSEEGTAFCDI